MKHHLTWMALLSLLLWIVQSASGTLFGFENLNLFLEEFGFIPNEPLKNFGLNLLLSPFFHLDFSHWLTNLFLIWFLGRQLNQRIGSSDLSVQFRLFLFYGLVAVIILLSYLLPIAPQMAPEGRVFGLSGVVFALGGILIIHPKGGFYRWFSIFFIFWTIQWGTADVVTQWGHHTGLALGLVIGLLLRMLVWKKTKKIATNFPSYQ